MSKYSIRKFDGDDEDSWAVFFTDRIKGLGKIIFYGKASPIVCGLNKEDAKYHKKSLEQSITKSEFCDKKSR